MTTAERAANENSARRRATQPRSASNDLPEMKSTPVEHPHSFTSSLLTQPSTKPFSGLPSRPQLTSPQREAGEAYRERSGIVYPLLPRAACPHTRLQVEAALPEAAAFERRTRPPTVLDIELEGEDSQPPGPRRRQSRKRCHNRSMGVYRPSKHSPPRGRWCD